MRRLLTSVIILATMCVGALRSQTGFNGTWHSTDFPQGPTVFEFDVKGSTVTGTIGVGAQDSKLENGRITGDTIVFTGKSPDGTREATFTGKLTGDTISVKRSVVVKDGGARGGRGPFGADAVQQFTLHRGKPPAATAPASTAPAASTPQRGR